MTFPPNMTSILQPLDLVVNGPIKKYIKAKRTEAYVTAFRKFKIDWIKPNSDQNAVFKAPNPKLPETLRHVIDVFHDNSKFKSDKMKTSIANSFIDCGLTPESAPEPSNANTIINNSIPVVGLISARPKLAFREFDLFKSERKEATLKLDPINGGSLLRGSDFEDDLDDFDINDIDDIDEQEDDDELYMQIQADEDDEIEGFGEYIDADELDGV